MRDGRSKHPLYYIWAAMHQRCLDPNHSAFKYYGGRGIKVCVRWLDFWSFVQDVGSRPSKSHSIERVNPDGNYTPENCRWATAGEQSVNKRNTRWIEIGGRKMLASEWAKELGLSTPTILARLRNGMSAEQAVKGVKGRHRRKQMSQAA